MSSLAITTIVKMVESLPEALQDQVAEQFKCINQEENIWSVRITRNYRAIGILDKGTVSWFWIGSHDDYKHFFS
jgi:hypothetical protein